jgi:translocation and assembly module TamB
MGPSRHLSARLLGGLVRALSVAALTAVFLVGAAGALIGHVNTAAGRRVTAALLDRVLRDLFQGEVRIGSLQRVSTDRVVAEDVKVMDPEGRVVLQVSRLTARADLADIALQVVRGDARLSIVVDSVRVERAEAEVVPASDGLPTIAHAFALRPTPSTSPPGEARAVRVSLPAIEVGALFARGRLEGTPVLEAEVKGARGSVLVDAEGAAVDLRQFSLVARGVGGADARGVASLHVRAPGAVWGSFDGYLGEVQFGSVVRWERDVLDLKLDLPRAEPAATRALLAAWPLQVPAEARLHLKGIPPELDVELTSTLGERATVNASGHVNFASPLRLQLEVEGRRLDLRAVLPQAPETRIDVDAELGLRMESGGLALDLSGAVQPLTVRNVSVPALSFTSSSKGGIFSGHAKLHDVGLPMDVEFAVLSDGKLELEAKAKKVSLSQVERLRPYFDGDGNVDVSLRASLDQGRLDSSVTVDARRLTYQGALLDQGRLAATLRGPIEAWQSLSLDARVSGKRLSAGRFAFEEVSATARGPLRAPVVTTTLKDRHGPSFDARATVAWGERVSVRELSVGVLRDAVSIRGEVAALEVTEDRVLVRDLRIRGATGELTGNAELTPLTLNVNAQGQNLDLSAFSRVLGLPRGVLEGRGSVAIDVVAGGQKQRGNLELSVKQAALFNLNGISGQLSARLDGSSLSGASTGTVEGLGAFSSEWDAELGGPLAERRAYERATGKWALSMTELTLDYLGQLVPEPQIDVTGRGAVSLVVSRDEPDAVPRLEASLETRGLGVTIERPGKSPLRFDGLELLASAAHDGANGGTSAAVSLARGAERLATASADMTLDLKAALAGSEPLLQQLERRELAGKLVVSRVDLETLPEPLRVPGLKGEVRLEGTMRGSVSAPLVSLSTRAANLRFGAGERAELIDVCGSAEYAKESGAFNVGAEIFLSGDGAMQLSRVPCGGKRVAALQFRGEAPLDTATGVPRWNGTASANLEALPLSTLPPLASARMTGTATGKLVLAQSGEQRSASALLTLAGVRVDQLTIGDGSLKLRSDEKQARVDFELERGRTKVSGSVMGGVTWASQAPAVDDAQAIDLELHARRLEASVLEPFLAELVTELRGTVDGDVTARLSAPKEKGEAREVDHVSGQVGFQNGSLVLTGLGFRLRDVAFSADAKRDGATTLVEIPNLVASAGSRVPNLKARVGLRLRGFDIVSGSASFNVDGLPLVMDGITRANADVRVSKLDIKRTPDRIVVDIPFDRLTIRLPDESSRDLIDLKENENITILQPIAQPKLDRDESSLPWQLAFHLGDDARVERGEQLDVPISGDPIVVLASGVGVTGSIMLPRRGAVQMLGRMFQIEGGAIVFDTPDPADPRLDVRASWRSSTNDTLFMYISGTVSKPKVQFDRPQAAAVALLAGTTESGKGATNVGISALDSLLADTPLARVQLRGKDADEAGKGATYTAAYRASDRVVVEGNYQAAAAQSSSQPGQGSTIGAAVDYRVTKTLSVRGQLGTIGTGVDLVYQYRY